MPDQGSSGACSYFVAEMDIYVYRYLCPQAIQTVLSDVDRFPPLRKRTPRVDLVGTGKADEERRQRRKQLLAEGK